MRNFKLKIAGYKIGLEASANGPDLEVSPRFLRNLDHDPKDDIHIVVNAGIINLPAEAVKVFHAPFIEEKDGILTQNDPNFWSIWKTGSWLYIKTTLPLSAVPENAVLRFSLSENVWDLWMDSADRKVDPFGYPVDGLVLYYLTVINHDIMVHASGVNNAGDGMLFTGVSGKGKSTIAKLWDDIGASIIHDDRLIIRKTGDGYRMFNTPVYDDDTPLDSPLNRIYIIEHGKENRLMRIGGAAAVSQVMANCIQHNWDNKIIAPLLDSVSELCRRIPVYRLQFRPEHSVTDLILRKSE